jgi:hypothetical protein
MFCRQEMISQLDLSNVSFHRRFSLYNASIQMILQMLYGKEDIIK